MVKHETNACWLTKQQRGEEGTKVLEQVHNVQYEIQVATYLSMGAGMYTLGQLI